MKLNSLLRYVFIVVLIFSFGYSKGDDQQINVNFKNLEIEDLIKMTSKIIDKNILMTNDVKGKVDFISNKPVYKKDVLNLLIYVLEAKGYTIIDNNDILRVVRLSDAAKYNLPVYENASTVNDYKMVTEVFNIENMNVDYVTSKIRHFISKNAKLVTDKETNAVIITDFYDNIATIKNIITIIAKDNQKTIELIELKNLKGETIVNDLKAVAKVVFDETIEKEKVEILLNKDTNSILFVGKKSNVKFLVDYLKDIDAKGSLVEKVVEVVYLKNVESKNILNVIKGVVAQKIYKDKNEMPFVSSDDESNAVILMGSKDEINYLKELINKLDVDKQQVFVQAKIIELSEKGTSNMGIKYGLEGLASGSDGALTFAGNLGGSSIAVSPAVLSKIDIPKISDGLILGASINLLKQNSAVDVVSEPSILCINNKESSIYVGETTSVSTQTNNGTTTSTSYKREDIGLKLKVKPRISNSDKVTLEINAVLEDISKIYDDATIPPDTNKKELSTLAIVNNGESVILGGLIKNKNLTTEDKVPFFGDIPVLGALFRNNVDTTDKINLVIIVTPYIVPQSKDLSYVRDQLAQLKLLEDKYTKDLALRLEQMKINEQKEDLERDKIQFGLNEVKNELSSDKKEFEESKKSYEKQQYDYKKLHDQRVKEMFGI
ncbi:MAG: hypothetical protein IE909_01225 [Campylobacterales bacterium]|nr:hypothetical protein [Campylobacterales bacterium]